jgi:hypothetical protein
MNEFGKALMDMIRVSINRLMARKIPSGVTMLALAGIVLLLAAGGASAKDCGTGVADCECGDTVVADWTFTGNMSCSTGNGLIVGSDNITIDGNGYKLSGDVANASCSGGGGSSPCVAHSGVINDGGWDNVVVNDLEIENFCTGIVIGTTRLENMTVTGCKIHDCGRSESITHDLQYLWNRIWVWLRRRRKRDFYVWWSVG